MFVWLWLMWCLGAYAEYIAVSMNMLVHKPTGMSWEEAAGIPEVRDHHLRFHADSSEIMRP